MAAAVVLLTLLAPAATAADQDGPVGQRGTAVWYPGGAGAPGPVTPPLSPAGPPPHTGAGRHEAGPASQATAPRLTVRDERGPAFEVLPFGTGLACLGLGLGLVGIRLRQRT